MKKHKNLKEIIDIDLNENLSILTLVSMTGLVGDNPKIFIFKFLKNEIVLSVIFVIILWHTIVLNNEKRKMLKKRKIKKESKSKLKNKKNQR